MPSTPKRQTRLSHVDERGRVRMVDVGPKPETIREAVADGHVRMSAAAVRAIRQKSVAKGDPLQTARLAGIMAAKRTAEIIPLCHPVPLTHVDVELVPRPRGYLIEGRARTVGRTGVEMEALVAVSVAALTLYDMLKAIDRTIAIGPIRLREKRGGEWHLPSQEMSVPSTPRTIAELPFFVAGRFLKPDLVGRCVDGKIDQFNGRELVERVRDFSLGLTGLGLTRGGRVAILSESRPEWLIADFAVLAAGAVTIPIYPTLSPDQVSFILRDSGATIAIVSTEVQLEKIRAVAGSLPVLQAIVMIEEMGERLGSDPWSSASDPNRSPIRLLSFQDVAADGHRRILDGWGVAREYQDRARAVGPDDLATIIYTSGTTGQPKGVMLTHGNLAANVEGVLSVLDLNQDDTSLSFLPLCHAFERTVSYVCLAAGVSVVFAESIDTIARDLLVVRPTVMSGVPRVFEKLYARVLEKGRQTTGIRRRIFEWAVSIAVERGRQLSEGRSLSLPLRLASPFAERQVFSKIRAGIGGRLRWAVSGSAPLNIDIARFFFGVGLPILEGYGLTETAPVLSVMPPRRVRFGTVGPPLPNVEIRIAPDGEVLARGPNVMRSYFERPEDTAAVLTDGWFHTGDIGNLDEQGYLRITDRKKELLVTSGGKKIAPQPIEERLRAHPLVNEAMLVGDRRHFPAALINPDFGALGSRLKIDGRAARARVDADDVRALYQQVIDDVNRDLAQFERIKKFVVLANDFSIATGELTPTLKIKRRVVEAKYRDVIEGMYV